MAIVWDDWSQRIRLGWDVTQSPASVGAGTSSVTLTVSLHFRATYAYSHDQTVTVSGGGGIAESFTYQFVSSNGTTTTKQIKSWTITVPTSYADEVSRTFTASVSQNFFDGARPTASRTWKVGKRPPQSPSAPTSASVSYLLGASQAVASWVRPGNWSSDAYRWASVTIQQQTDTGAFTNVVTELAPTSTSRGFTPKANSRCRWRVRAQNATGSSAWVTTPYVYSTPAPVTALSAQKVGADIHVKFASNSPWANGFELRDTATNTVVATGASSPLVHASANPAVVHRYQVQAVVPGGRVSGWSGLSNPVQLQAKPSTPTNLTPNGISVLTGTITLGYVHVPVDTTAQRKRQIRYRLLGAATWTTLAEETTTSQTRTLTLAAGMWEWQVRTWGAHVDPSEYSASAVVSVEEVPEATILAPDGTIPGSSTTVQVAYAQSDGVPHGATQVQVVNDGLSGVPSLWAWHAQWYLGSAAFVKTSSPDEIHYDGSGPSGNDLTNRLRGSAYQTRPAGSTVRMQVVASNTSLADASLQVGLYRGAGGTYVSSIWPGDSIRSLPAGSDRVVIAVDVPVDYPGDGSDQIMPILYVRGATPVTIHRIRCLDVTDLPAPALLADSGILLGAITSWTTPPVLPDGSDVTIRARVRTATKLWSGWDETTVPVVFLDPAAPVLEASWLPAAGCVEITAAAVEQSEGQAETVTLALERSIGGQDWVRIADTSQATTDGLSLGWLDYEAPLSGSLRYQAVAVSALPSTATTMLEVVSPHDSGDHDQCGIWINAGPGFATGVLLVWDPDLVEATSLDGTEEYWDDRPEPVPSDSVHVRRSIAVTAAWFAEKVRPAGEPERAATRESLGRIPWEKGLHLYRDPSGRTMYCKIRDMSVSDPASGVGTVSFTAVQQGRATPVQLEAVGAWQASRIEHLGDGRYVLAGGGGLLETSPGEYIVVDTAASP